MASIGASTMHRVKGKAAAPGRTATASKAKPAAPLGIGGKKSTMKKIGNSKAKTNRRGSIAAPLSPATLTSATAIQKLRDLDNVTKKERVVDYVRKAMGEQPMQIDRSAPRAASTTRDRAGAAADVAVVAKTLGVAFVLKEAGILQIMQRMLFPDGLDELLTRNTATDEFNTLRPSASSVSLASMENFDFGDDITVTSIQTGMTGGTDTKRGKSAPANAREGSLLIVRALCEKVGRAVEPYVVGGFLAAALDECGSSSSAVREAAEDTATALITAASPWAMSRLVCPVLIQSLASSEWRVKYNALERLGQCAATSPVQTCQILPMLIPLVTAQVWDTKPQVNKAAGHCLLQICQTNQNPDVLPAIPAVVTAVCKPSETVKAVQELMATTFVAPVDASTLAILCPVLSRGLKEKMAINKRATCLVITNMSKLVENPASVAPFGPLLLPELQKMVTNVAFEELRDNALSALNALTKALGEAETAANAKKMEEANAKIKLEQDRIAEERKVEEEKEKARELKELAERKQFKEAMEAQRLLEKLAIDKEKEERAEELKRKEAAKLSTKSEAGKCQSCGLKKCRPTCLFFTKK